MYSNWEGSVADSAMFNEACLNDLFMPDGKYYLANAGFPSCTSLMVPFQGVHYHLTEWGQADLR